MEEISKIPTLELVQELTKLEKEIDLKIMRYNLLIKEMYNRFPMLEEHEEFQPKVLKKGVIYE